MKIAFVVHGRFMAFDIASALRERGHDVTVYTNYPKFAATRWGLRKEDVRSFRVNGLLFRLLIQRHNERIEEWLHRSFGRWAARRVAGRDWDAVYTWSGVSLELLKKPRAGRTYLVRGSAHIRTQAELLMEEEIRTNSALPKPAAWRITREEAEYRSADQIIVLSSFALDTFIQQGFKREQLFLLPMGGRMDWFKSTPAEVAARIARLKAGDPLRVLFVGSLALQKGLHDLARVIMSLDSSHYHFRLVGTIDPDAAAIISEIDGRAEILPRQKEQELRAIYRWGDVFIFPTIQDGYALVLKQAQLSGLPLLVSTNCAGPDLVREGATGWVLPIRRPDAYASRLRWMHSNRSEVASMVENIGRQSDSRSWSDVASDLEQAHRDSVS